MDSKERAGGALPRLGCNPGERLRGRALSTAQASIGGAALLRSGTKADAAPPHFTRAASTDFLPALRGEAKSLASSVWSPPGGGGFASGRAVVASAYVRGGAKVN
jgi:hypothetical protein